MNNFLILHFLILSLLENNIEVSATSRKLDGGKTNGREVDRRMLPFEIQAQI